MFIDIHKEVLEIKIRLASMRNKLCLRNRRNAHLKMSLQINTGTF